MSVLSDKWIRKMSKEEGMITPFEEKQVRGNSISYGLSSFGYDARVSEEFKIFTNVNSEIVDPKNFKPTNFVTKNVSECIIPPNSFVLARTVEKFKIPDDVLVICLGKSTYARCGIIVNVTPLEPGWEGYVTLEFSNTTPLPAKIYANEGVAQFIFLKGNEKPEVTYADRNGKYMGQTGVTLPKSLIMQKLEVFGANKLKGQIKISGSKNASLPILAATLLASDKIFLNNLPNVKDIETMINLLQSLGSKIKFDKQKLIIDNSKQHKKIASYSLVKTMRAGILVLGPLLAKFGSAKVSLPGGCAIGTRPVDIHLKALSKLGVKYKIIEGYVHATAPKGLIGSKIRFSKISVGATENLIIAASLAKGTTILSNCAIEPEIKDLVNFLIKAGCNIKWIAKRSLKIVGVNKINETTYTIMFDRIEAGTYLVAAAVTEGNLKIKNVIPSIIQTEINTLKKIGAKISTKKDEIHIIGNKKINGMNIKTAPYPGFPTDLQAQIMVLLCKANKKSLIKEDIFENRFMHVAELNRMGAQISTNGNKAIIEGNIKFAAAELMATDLRASVSLILAALTAKGKSVINRIYHLDRGYESIEKKLKKVGAKIRRVN